MESLRQRRHRAALLRAASNWLRNRYSPGDPDFQLIRPGDGREEPADVGVLVDVAAELHRMAEHETATVDALMKKKLGDIEAQDCPLVEGTVITAGPTRESTSHEGEWGTPPLPNVGSSRARSSDAAQPQRPGGMLADEAAANGGRSGSQKQR